MFDRKLSGPDEADGSDGNDVANWLYCEWTAQAFKGGDRFIIAAGTITKENSVDVACAALAVVTPTSPVEFETAGKIGFEDGKIKKTHNLDEQQLQSYLNSFRSGFVNGATLYSGDLED